MSSSIITRPYFRVKLRVEDKFISDQIKVCISYRKISNEIEGTRSCIFNGMRAEVRAQSKDSGAGGWPLGGCGRRSTFWLSHSARSPDPDSGVVMVNFGGKGGDREGGDTVRFTSVALPFPLSNRGSGSSDFLTISQLQHRRLGEVEPVACHRTSLRRRFFRSPVSA